MIEVEVEGGDDFTDKDGDVFFADRTGIFDTLLAWLGLPFVDILTERRLFR